MDNKEYLTKDEILDKTGIKYYKLDYLVRSGQVPVIKRGSGKKRLYPPEALEIVLEHKENINKG